MNIKKRFVYQMSYEVTGPNEEPGEAELDGGGDVLVDVPADVVLVLSHRKLWADQVTSDEETVAEHLYQARQLGQRCLLLILA